MRYRIDFVGGDRNGESLSSHSDDKAEFTEASVIFDGTKQGTIGKRYWAATNRTREQLRNDAPLMEIIPQKSIYKVCERIEEDGVVIIKMKHVGTENPRSPKQ